MLSILFMFQGREQQDIAQKRIAPKGRHEENQLKRKKIVAFYWGGKRTRT